MSYDMDRMELEEYEKKSRKRLTDYGLIQDVTILLGRYAMVERNGRYALLEANNRILRCFRVKLFEGSQDEKDVGSVEDIEWFTRSGPIVAGARAAAAEMGSPCGPETWMWGNFMTALVRELE
jgi:hypothetical protein